MWLITNKDIESGKQGLHHMQYSGYTFITDDFDSVVCDDGNYWFCDGYMLPRQRLANRFSALCGANLAATLHSEFRDHFIQHVKGNFILLQLSKKGFTAFSDHFGKKKFFYWQSGNEFVVSNDLKVISNIVHLNPASVGMAVYALTYHFTGGYTAFRNLFHNQPGEMLELKNSSLTARTYWHPDELLDCDSNNIEIKDIAEQLKSTISTTLDATRSVSLSLTGGADTRNLLSVLLSQGVRPHLYTYGNPLSNDCVKASAIASGLGLEHTVHDISMTSEVFEHNARRIIRMGGGLASIHRVHRLLAVEAESPFASQMYLGTLGGEYVRGVSEDDYIVPAIVFENWDNTDFTDSNLDRYLKTKRLNITEDAKAEILSYLRHESFMSGTAVRRKHCALSFITAHLHDAQDVNLYNMVMRDVHTPFLDIDYLLLLFSSAHVFTKKEKIKNIYLKKIQNPVYGSKFLKEVYPPLLRFKYSGEHKPSEVLLSKHLAAFLKGFRQKTHKKYPPNFPLGQWMVDFVKKNLPPCRDYQSIKEVFELDRLIHDFENYPHGTNEAYWLKFTNPIMMRFILEEYHA